MTMTREELDFIGSMNMCDEISNEAYKKIVCHCEENDSPCDLCRYNPPSSVDGKPCTMCPAESEDKE